MKYSVKEGILTITVDLKQEGRLSQSGKSVIIDQAYWKQFEDENGIPYKFNLTVVTSDKYIINQAKNGSKKQEKTSQATTTNNDPLTILLQQQALLMQLLQQEKPKRAKKVAGE